VATLDDATSVEPSFVADLAGDYGLSLVVSDRSEPALATVPARRQVPIGFNRGMEQEIDTGESPDVAQSPVHAVPDAHGGPPRTWPPSHDMARIEVDVSGLVSQNPDSFQAYVTGVEVFEPDRKTGDDIQGR
jgi:hypothetical protein